MKNAFKIAAACFFGTVVLIVIGAMLTGANLEMTRFFGTRMESIKTDIYRENKSYVEGTVRDLRELRVQYDAAGEGHRDALRSLIIHRAGELNRERLPTDIRQFLSDLE